MKLSDIKIHQPHSIELVDIPDSIYFSSRYDDYISNSKLGLINPDEGGSPEKYKRGLANNKIYSDPLVFGNAVHCLTLQPEDFYLVEDIDRPAGKPGFMIDWMVSNNLEFTDENIQAAAKEVNYFKGSLSDDKLAEVKLKSEAYYNALVKGKPEGEIKDPLFLSSYDRYRCKRCLSSLFKNSKIQKHLYTDEAEILNEIAYLSNLFVEFPDGGKIELKFKGKLDSLYITEDKIVLNDLKTTGKQIEDFPKSFETFHYARQLAKYLYFTKFAYTNKQDISANILAVSTKDPFTSKVFPLSPKDLQSGLKELSNLIKTVAFYEYYGYDYKKDNIEYDAITI